MSRDRSPTERPAMNWSESAWTMYSLREIHLEMKVKIASPAPKAHQDLEIRRGESGRFALIVVMEEGLWELHLKARWFFRSRICGGRNFRRIIFR